jgi:hypothetical protein
MKAVGTYAVTNRLENSNVRAVAVRGVNEQKRRRHGASLPAVLRRRGRFRL